jgi:hypothetical protein
MKQNRINKAWLKKIKLFDKNERTKKSRAVEPSSSPEKIGTGARELFEVYKLNLD